MANDGKYIGQMNKRTTQTIVSGKIQFEVTVFNSVNLLADLYKYQSKQYITKTISIALSQQEFRLKFTAMSVRCFDFISVAHLNYN